MSFYAVQEAPNRWVTRLEDGRWVMATTYEGLRKKVAKELKCKPKSINKGETK